MKRPLPALTDQQLREIAAEIQAARRQGYDELRIYWPSRKLCTKRVRLEKKRSLDES